MTGSPAPTNAVYRRPWLYPLQERAIFDAHRYSVIEASTKSGKTAGCLVWAAEKAMRGDAGQNVWWVAPVYSQAKMAFRRMKRALPRQLIACSETELTIEIQGRAKLWFKGSDNPDNLYGEDVIAAVIDEASRCKEDAWHAVRSTLTATRGQLRVIGNVKGRRNWAYRIGRLAEAGEIDAGFHRLTWRDAVAGGVLDAGEVEDAKRVLPEAVYRELYEAEASDDDGNPFGLEAIRACVGDFSHGFPVCWGWDLAKSTDWTVGVAFDKYGRVCRFERFQRPWEVTIDAIVEKTQRVAALVDSTGVGDPVLEALQKRQPGTFEGFKFSSTSKQQLMEGLAVAIQQGAITYPDGVIASELEAFEYEYTRTGVRYGAPSGLHDDAVCALALAVRHRGNARDGIGITI